MAPGKVKLAFIADDTKRNATYMRRKQSVLKLTEELSTLCGIEACAIVYGPNDPEPEIWPSKSGVLNVLEKFRSMPEWEQSKRMVNQQNFVAQSIVKGKEKLQKLVKENKEKDISMFIVQCLNTRKFQPSNNMTSADLNVLSSLIDQNLKHISRRMEMLTVNQESPSQPQMQTPEASQPQSQMQNPSFQPEMQTSSHHSQMQTPTFQPHQMQTQSYQPQMQIPAPEDMTLLNYSNGSDMGFMDSLFGDGDETTLPPFGDPNFQL